jgi:hypothetical protein
VVWFASWSSLANRELVIEVKECAHECRFIVELCKVRLAHGDAKMPGECDVDFVAIGAERHLGPCQLPDPVVLSNGKKVTKPATW